MQAGATTKTDADLAARAQELDLGVFERASDHVVRDRRATLISTPSLRRVPHLHGEPWATGEDEVRDAHEADRRMLSGTPTRAFAVFEQGRPLAYALLLDGGRDGMLEDVFTTPGARGRGLATAAIAAVLHAARAERHELVFVRTAASGSAGPLYESLGFDRVATLRRLIKGRP